MLIRSLRDLCCRCLCGAIAALLASGSWSSAHELGTTQVVATFEGRQFVIEIAVDPDALLTKLEVFSGATLSVNPTREERDRRIESLRDQFLDRVAVVFDGQRAQPAFTYEPPPPSKDAAQAPSLVRLTGSVPFGAREVKFSNGLAIGAYALTSRVDGGEAETYWVDGSRTITIKLGDGTPAVGYILIVLAVFLLGVRLSALKSRAIKSRIPNPKSLRRTWSIL